MENSELLAIMWPNETRLDIQTRDRLCEYKWAHTPPADEELSNEFKEFRDKLNGIHGIEKADIGRHVVHVERFDIFTWEELVPQIAAVMTAFTGTEYTVRWDDRRNMYGYQKPFDNDD